MPPEDPRAFDHASQPHHPRRSALLRRARPGDAVLSEEGASHDGTTNISWVADPLDGGAALARALSEIDDFEWVVFTSANTVDRCWESLGGHPCLGRVKVAAIGAGTAAALAERKVTADLVPDSFVAESLVEVFPAPARPEAASVLLPCAAGARDVLALGLSAKGWQVEVVEAYRTVRTTTDLEMIEGLDGAEAITFTSSSTVTGYLELAGAARVPRVIACIGPVTASTARRAGLHVDVVAAVHSVEGLVEALVAWREQQERADDQN